jgi:hypothetical protein
MAFWMVKSATVHIRMQQRADTRVPWNVADLVIIIIIININITDL